MSTLSEHLPKLSHAEFEKYPEPVEVHYKSGASYTGMVSNHLRCGQGVFKWPNGARYEGQYSENARNGKGMINESTLYYMIYVLQCEGFHNQIHWKWSQFDPPICLFIILKCSVYIVMSY